MTIPRHDLGPARLVRAEAEGQPGKRVFRILLEAAAGCAVVTVEKEQLSALATGIQGLISEIGHVLMAESTIPTEISLEPKFEFRAFSLGLSYDQEDHIFAILIYDQEDARRDVPTLSGSFSRGQAKTFADEALELVTAGRPACALCKQPMDPDGHSCPMSNGHKPLTEEL